MTKDEITTMRTELANKFAEAGAAFLDFTGTGSALAPIEGTNPQQYAAAGTLETIRRIWPQDEERKVGCERADGLLNIHAESATCEVCAPVAATVLTDECAWKLATDLFGTIQYVSRDEEYVKLADAADAGEFARAIEAELLAHAAPAASLIAEARAVFDLMLEGCSLQCFGDYENGRGETIGPRMDALHDRLRAFGAQAAAPAEPAGRENLLRAALDAAEKWSQQEHLHAREIGRGGPGLLKKVERAERDARAAIKALAESGVAQVPAAEVRAQAQTEKAEQGKFAERLYGPAPSVDERRDALYTMALIFAAAESDSSREACFEDMYREFLAVPRMSIFDSLTRHTGAEISTNYTFETEEFFEVEAVERVLAHQSTADKASEVRAGELEQEIAQLKEQLEKKHKSHFITSQALHNTLVGNQAAWIEWQHGGGAEAAMTWIHNGLAGPGLIPDGKEAQPWFDANQDDRYEIPPMKEAGAAPSTADSAGTGAMGEGADRG